LGICNQKPWGKEQTNRQNWGEGHIIQSKAHRGEPYKYSEKASGKYKMGGGGEARGELEEVVCKKLSTCPSSGGGCGNLLISSKKQLRFTIEKEKKDHKKWEKRLLAN